MGKTLYLECYSGISGDMTVALPRLFMLPSIQSIPVYGFLFHPTKITSWGKNVQGGV